jgi:2-keto-4-pentenoate hydratase/2-oxohepta-3-ene-1,7-dioic acid hydratase in catechol pathway
VTANQILSAVLFLCAGLFPLPAVADQTGDNSSFEACLNQHAQPRVARVVAETGTVVYARVLQADQGTPSRFATIAPASTALDEVFRLAALGHAGEQALGTDADEFSVEAKQLKSRLCAPTELTRKTLNEGSGFIIAAGLNYQAHAAEAGGGDVFLFPKPSPPTSAYTRVTPPKGVTLLDYEVELGFVLLDDLEPASPIGEKSFLASSAFFVANDISDREPIIAHKGLSGPGTGFADSKGQPTFFPAGPWMVRGTELFAALDACGGKGLTLELSVDEGQGQLLRQSSTTELMIISAQELIARIADEIATAGRVSPMPLREETGDRFYGFATDAERPVLPAGSIVLTGTPDGVALQPPGKLGLVFRGLVHLRTPFSQLIVEEKARAQAGEPGGYLAAGDIVSARIQGLGTQTFEIGEAGAPLAPDPCHP